MKTLSKLRTTVALVFMTAAATPALAVSYHSYWELYRLNTGGTTYAVLPTNSDHFCTLSKVGVRETDTAGELAQCRIYRSGAVWILEAYLGTSSDADVYCAAYCYNN